MSDFDELTKEGPRWYVAHTYTGYENKVKTNIEKIVENRKLSDVIFDVRVPSVITTQVNEKGVVKEVEEKVFPSYVLVKMIMSDETWHVIRNISGVTGFVGPGSRPVPLTEEEAIAISVETRVSASDALAVGDLVDIVDGVFKGFSGKVSDIAKDSDEITVIVSTIGNDMPVILSAKCVRKKA